MIEEEFVFYIEDVGVRRSFFNIDLLNVNVRINIY